MSRLVAMGSFTVVFCRRTFRLTCARRLSEQRQAWGSFVMSVAGSGGSRYIRGPASESFALKHVGQSTELHSVYLGRDCDYPFLEGQPY